MHKHHILPKRLGGTDAEENLTPPISTALHAEFHRDLWEHYKDPRDFIAWKCLSGRMTNEEARLAAAKIGQDGSQKYKDSRKLTGQNLGLFRTKESCSAGGKSASKKLVAWQQENKEAFAKQAAENGRKSAYKRKISHMYNGVMYASKRDLQTANGMCNSVFYKKLISGEIRRQDDKHADE